MFQAPTEKELMLHLAARYHCSVEDIWEALYGDRYSNVRNTDGTEYSPIADTVEIDD